MADVAQPRKWYELFLVYPTLILALLGAVPTVLQQVQAWRLGVASKRVQIVEAQQVLWKHNLDCLRLKPVYTINLGEGVEVGVTLCGSGAALLKYQRSPEAISYTWIPYPPPPTSGEPPRTTLDEALPPQSEVVYGLTRCVLLQDLLVLWVQYDAAESETCHMDYIAMIGGARVQRRPVPCQTCEG